MNTVQTIKISLFHFGAKKIKPLTAAIACFFIITLNVAKAEEVLNNQSIISLTTAKLSNQIIINKIKSAPNAFDLSAAGIIALRQGKVADQVVEQMLLVAKNLPVMRNEDVIKLVDGKIAKNLILKKMSLSKCDFNTSTESLIALKTANVPEVITKAMMDPSVGVQGGSSSGETKSADITAHPQDLAPPTKLTTPGIYYEAYSPKVSYQEVEPTTTNNSREGSIGQSIGNHYTGGLSGSTKNVGLANQTSNTIIEDGRPVFYFYLSTENKDVNQIAEQVYDGVASPNDFVLVKANKTKRGREIQVGWKNDYTSETGFAKGTVPFRYKKISARLYKVYFEKDVPAGEYAFYYNKGSEQRSSFKLYDFSLRNNITEDKK